MGAGVPPDQAVARPDPTQPAQEQTDVPDSGRDPRRPDGRGRDPQGVRDRRGLGEPHRGCPTQARVGHRVRARAQRGGGRLRGRGRRAGLGAADRRARLVRTGQPAPGQRALRLPAQRRTGVRDRDAHPEHRDRQRLLPGDQPRGHLLRLHQLLRPVVHAGSDAAHLRAGPPGSDPRARGGHGDRPRGRRGPDGRARDAAPSRAHRPTGQPAHRRRPRQGGRARLARQEDRHPRRGGDASGARRGPPPLRDAEGAGVLRLPRQGRARGRQPVRASG